MRCPSGHDVPEGASFCPTCGVRSVPDASTCPNGHEVPAGASFCPVCGAQIQPAAMDALPTAPDLARPIRSTCTAGHEMPESGVRCLVCGAPSREDRALDVTKASKASDHRAKSALRLQVISAFSVFVGTVKNHRLITTAIVAVVAAAVVVPIALHKTDYYPTLERDGRTAVDAAVAAENKCGGDVIDWSRPFNNRIGTGVTSFYYARKDGHGEVLSMMVFDDSGGPATTLSDAVGDNTGLGVECISTVASSVPPAAAPGEEVGCTAGASACAFDNGIDFNNLRAQISDELGTYFGAPIADVNCDVGAAPPNRVPVGETFPCTVTDGYGESSGVTVTVVGDPPFYEWVSELYD